MNFNNVIAKLIQIFHFSLCIFALTAPYLTNNNFYLICLIFYYVMVLTIWNINGRCFLTDMENELNGEQNSKESYVTSAFSTILGKRTKTVFSLVPLINTTVCLYKINLNKKHN
jgi:hypothetical protein